MMAVALKQDLSFCISNNHTVFLDLDADRYFCLPPALNAAFSRLLKRDATFDEADTDISALLKTGLFTTGSFVQMPIRPVEHSRPTQSALEDTFSTSTLGLMAAAATSQFATTVHLRKRSLPTVIERLRRRKAAMDRTASSLAETSLRRLYSFLALRRVIPNQNRCLQRSIALFEFLSQGGTSPDLVIGVRMQPFAAHAWVQIGDMVLNDHLDEVLLYTPILVV
jgi:hypothetical protein